MGNSQVQFDSHRKPRVVLVEPQPPDLHIFSAYPLPRLGTILLGAMLKEQGADVTVLVEQIGSFGPDDFAGADLVGISTTTSTANRAYALADGLRKAGTPVAIGGPHVSFMPEEAINHADYVVLGEGESILPPIVQAVIEGRTPDSVPGLMIQGQVQTPSWPESPVDLDTLPNPDFSVVRGMKRPWISKRSVIPIQATRGCPHGCSFCSVTGMFGRQFRFRSVSKVVEEVERYNDDRHHMFFYDDNLAANRRWLKELLTEFRNMGASFTWSGQVRVEVSEDEELLELIRATNCTSLFIGFESVDPVALEGMNKHQTPDEIDESMRRFNHWKIPVHGMFVMGFDTDTPESVSATVDFGLKTGMNTAQFLILTPFPGTDVYHELDQQGRIFLKDWGVYDGHHATFVPAGMDPLTLQEVQLDAHARFYSVRRGMKKAIQGDFADALIYGFGKALNWNWKRKNQPYLKMLERMSRTNGGNAWR